MVPLLVNVPVLSNCRTAVLLTAICPPATLFTTPPSALVPETATIWPVEVFVRVPPWIVPLDRFRIAFPVKVTAPPLTTAPPVTVPVVPAPSRMVPLVLVKVAGPVRVSCPAVDSIVPLLVKPPAFGDKVNPAD